MGICAFIEHYLEEMGYVRDPWVQLNLPRGLEKTAAIIHISGPGFFGQIQKDSQWGYETAGLRNVGLAVAQCACYSSILKRRHISE